MPPQMSGPPRQASQTSSNVQGVNGKGEIDSHTSSPDSRSSASKRPHVPVGVAAAAFLPWPCKISV